METIISSVITGVFSLIAGLVGGYTFGIKKNKKQIQKARDNAKQVQIGEINNGR